MSINTHLRDTFIRNAQADLEQPLIPCPELDAATAAWLAALDYARCLFVVEAAHERAAAAIHAKAAAHAMANANLPSHNDLVAQRRARSKAASERHRAAPHRDTWPDDTHPEGRPAA